MVLRSVYFETILVRIRGAMNRVSRLGTETKFVSMHESIRRSKLFLRWEIIELDLDIIVSMLAHIPNIGKWLRVNSTAFAGRKCNCWGSVLLFAAFE